MSDIFKNLIETVNPTVEELVPYVHVHKFDSAFGINPTVLQGLQFFILNCECGACRGFGGKIVRPWEAAIYGHTE